MATVAVSAERFRSMLANRNITPEKFAEDTTTEVDVVALAVHDAEIHFDDLRAIAGRLNQPWSSLLIDKPEPPPKYRHDNRTVKNQRVPVSGGLYEVLAATDAMLEAAEELFPDVRAATPPGPWPVGQDPEAVGGRVRSFLGVSIDEQVKRMQDYAALRLWRDAIETRGVYVSQRQLADPTVRALSMARGSHAVIVLDTGDTPYARVFSLIHEYCHLMLKSEGICDLSQYSRVERHCNAVAASTLLPLDALRTHVGRTPFGADAEADDTRLWELSHALHVSQAALLIRLQQVGWITDELYDALEKRRQGRRTEKKPGKPTYYTVRINRVGRRFARNVFRALDAEAIDRADASVLLDVGEHLIERYRSALATGGDSE